MPIIKSAKKKVKQDKTKRIINLKTIDKYKGALSLARKKPTLANIKAAESLIDQAAKKKIIHKNKASRLISRLTKRIVVEKTEKPVKKSEQVKGQKLKGKS